MGTFESPMFPAKSVAFPSEAFLGAQPGRRRSEQESDRLSRIQPQMAKFNIDVYIHIGIHVYVYVDVQVYVYVYRR